MRALVSRIGLVSALTVGLFGSTAKAQFRDTLQVGDRVRVRVAATRGSTNLFVGNLSSVSADTLVIDIPGGQGRVTLPRTAISEVAVSQGDGSHLRNLPGAMLFAVPGTFLATASPPPGPHENAHRNLRVGLTALYALGTIVVLGRRPPEKWEPMYRWLEGR